MKDKLINFREVSVEKPVDAIIRQVQELLIAGALKPGDRLPPERKLSEQFGVGRTHVRDAIRKLEFYGILKTRPQSGTYVASIGLSALEGLIADILKVDTPSFVSLVETRVLLETSAIRLACERRTDEDLALLEESLNSYAAKARQGIRAVEEDLMFHLTIADMTKNKALKSLLMIIVPDIITNYTVFKVCDTLPNKAMEEHEQLFRFIREGNAPAAEAMMQEHLKGVMDFARLLVQ